ncbi:putative 60S ribosomal protein L3, partial [Daphnia magna]
MASTTHIVCECDKPGYNEKEDEQYGKVDWVREYLEKAVLITSSFAQDGIIDVIGVNKEKGFKGNY